MPTLTRKYRLQVVGDDQERSRVYKYIRNAMDATYKCYNEYMSARYIAELKSETDEEKEELTKLVNKLYSRQTGTKLESAFTSNIEFPKGLALASTIENLASKKFKDIKNDVINGRVSLPTYKKDGAVPLHVRYVSLEGEKGSGHGFHHGYDTLEQLYYGLEKDLEPKVFLRFPDKIEFRVCFGNPYKSREQRKVFMRIFSGEYKSQGSSIQINSKGKIILNLTMEVPKKEMKHIDGVVVGVDLGMAIPAMCALNNDLYDKCDIGNINDFLRVRTAIAARRRRLQKSLTTTNGGHGRTKKLQALDRFAETERNFVQTYNHMVSRNVVDYAVKHGAVQINVEDLSGFGRDKNGKSLDDERKKKVLRNWSYFELQQQITYKAAQYGIEVRKVNPAYTSQTCSYCGTIGERPKQAVFICSNPDCKCHEIYQKNKDHCFNADFNAARNIAMSTDYTDVNSDGEKKKTVKKKKKADKKED